MSKRQRGGQLVSTGRSNGGRATGKKKSKTVKELVEAELRKRTDLGGADTGLNIAAVPISLTDNTGGVFLNALILGDENWKRQHAGLNMRSLRLRYRVLHQYKHALVTGNIFSNQVRMTVIHDKEPDATIPAWSTIFKNLDPVGITSTTFSSSLNFNETNRFTVLREEILTMNPDIENSKGLDDEVHESVQVDWFIPLKGRKAMYKKNVATGNVGDMMFGALYFFAKARVNDLHSKIQIAGISRFRWED